MATGRTDRVIGLGALLAGVSAVTLVALGIVYGTPTRPSTAISLATESPATAIFEPIRTPPSTPVFPSASPTATASPTAVPVINAALPVVACKTTYGDGERPKPVAKTERVKVRADLADRLAVFATNHQRVVGPAGWRCDAEVGGNSTARLELSGGVDDAASIVAEDAAVSFGYVLDLACPLFPEAARRKKADFGESCVRPDPKEVVRSSGRTIKQFEDPPGLSATGEGSGGAYPSIGAVWFVGGSEPTAAKISCVLPAEERAVCNAIVRDWIGRVR